MNNKAIGKIAIAGIIIVIVVIAALGIYFAMYYQAPPPEESVLIMGTTDKVEVNLDPAEAYDYFGWEIIQSTGCGLVTIRPGSDAGPEDILPSLATDWDVSDDGLEWTFYLRHGVKFEDGTEFNATHVWYTFERAKSLSVPEGPFVGIGIYTKDGECIIKNVTVVDKYTVKFYLNFPFTPFLALMAAPCCYIVNPNYAPMNATVNYVEGNARASYPMDLGPYRLTKWSRVGGLDQEMILEANPNYWNATGGYPKTKKIIIKFYSDSTSLRLAIESGEIDIAFRQLSAADINSLRQNPNLKVWEGTGAFIQYLVFQTKPEMYPLNITEVRRAIAAAINRTLLTETVFQGQMVPLYSMIPNGMMGHIDAFKALGDANYTYTREVLAKYGYNEANKLHLDLYYETSGHYPQSPDQAQAIKQSLEASGVIEVSLHGLEWAQYREQRKEETMPLMIYGWYPDYVDPDNYVYPFLHSSGGSWLHYHYNNTQMDALIEQARSTTNATLRLELYKQIQELMVEDCPIVPLFQGTAFAVTKPDVKGVYLDITQSWRHWLLYKESS